ncbi:pyruvate dehydrogenase (acetyl-transferring) E1 component subunit alpha [Aeromicrobium sp. 50.2.37]|uniref:pyruvate dehydrogenase (acetyl-transferring) E1 component subunit alpha n=1 Tax=Aeromicrobium sp. 50.2.37 TaxID=2969305 RepID=UPI00214F901A|nr:pyruvate dehydrogenase (acetyl-transferring) E1 component subunit alpha [Aeromicrobium sp. 50.2.37]MCR4513275.1 pyruvate dehydrogenase (acetyl-transferring) E1 component subunit alpha [Aeromicrobium sp. 50.2.37]
MTVPLHTPTTSTTDAGSRRVATPSTVDTELVQLLTPEGRRVEHERYAFEGDDESIRAMYRDLLLVRRIDHEAHALQRHGELGLWAQCLGQEAAQVGSGRALAAQDFAFPTYREHGVAWCRGIDPAKLLGLFRGVELGGWDPAETGMALYSIIIGAQTMHATGYAMGLQRDGVVGTGDQTRDAAALAYFGDGASSQGDVHEAFVWASSFNAPVVFFCQNNHWAISVPTARQSRVPLVQRAAGYGFGGVRVDGNDVLAVHAVTQAALQRARDGEGPTLVEAVTYRMGAHTTSDDPTRYRDTAEVEEWKHRDPLARVETYLREVDTPESFFTDLQTEAEDLGAHLREACRSLPEPDLGALFDGVYADAHPELAEQKAEYLAYRASFETEGGAA